MFLVPMETGVIAGTLLNLFFIMLIAVYTIHRRLRTVKDTSFLEDIRAVMRGTASYAVLATVLFSVYMYGIAGDVTATHQAAVQQEIMSHFETDEAFAAFIESNPQFEGGDREKIREESLGNFQLYASWYVQTTLSLLGLVVFATFASLITTVFWRNLFGS